MFFQEELSIKECAKSIVNLLEFKRRFDLFLDRSNGDKNINALVLRTARSKDMIDVSLLLLHHSTPRRYSALSYPPYYHPSVKRLISFREKPSPLMLPFPHGNAAYRDTAILQSKGNLDFLFALII